MPKPFPGTAAVPLASALGSIGPEVAAIDYGQADERRFEYTDWLVGRAVEIINRAGPPRCD